MHVAEEPMGGMQNKNTLNSYFDSICLIMPIKAPRVFGKYYLIADGQYKIHSHKQVQKLLHNNFSTFANFLLRHHNFVKKIIRPKKSVLFFPQVIIVNIFCTDKYLGSYARVTLKM
jgi:hypothetical protein